MNNDLISRSALLESITFDRKAAKLHPQEICERFERFCDYAEEVAKDAPAVDAEVVRCKDCKFSSPSYIKPEIFKRCSLFCKTVNADFFCGHGEKMDAEVEG